jgi:putative transposase
VGSFSELSSAGVHSIGWHLAWCPKCRKKVLVEPVARYLRELIQAKAKEPGRSVEALDVRPDQVHLFLATPPDASPAPVAHRSEKGKP